MIDRRVSAFLHGLARSQTGVQSGRPGFRETRCDTGFELVKVPVLQGIMQTTHDRLSEWEGTSR